MMIIISNRDRYEYYDAVGDRLILKSTPAGSMNLFARTVASTSAFPIYQEGRPLH